MTDRKEIPEEFVLTEEQQALRSHARAFCQQAWSEAEVRRHMRSEEPAFDAWTRLGRELGLLGLAVPAEHGGAGAGRVELALLAEESGRVLACWPLLSSSIAVATLLATGDDESCAAVLPDVLDGERCLVLVATDDRGAWASSTPDIHAKRRGKAWSLRGRASHVLDGDTGDALLVLAVLDGGPALFLVDAASRGVQRRPLPTLDLTRRQAELAFDDVSARLVAAGDTAWAALGRATDVGAVVLAGEAVGGMRAILDRTVAHARDHHQFGRPIGSFQAVRHRCADMAIAVEHAQSVAHHAAWVADHGTDDLGVASSLAHVVAMRAYKDTAGSAIQVHGGIGFTWEHVAHLYLKRAWSDASLIGGTAFHRGRIAPLLTPAAA